MNDEKWTKDREAEAIRILEDDCGLEKSHQWYYRIRRTFELTRFGDVEKVRRKRGGIMVPTECHTRYHSRCPRRLWSQGRNKTAQKAARTVREYPDGGGERNHKDL